MVSGRRYRLAGVSGTLFISTLAVVVANHPVVQQLTTTTIPVFARLPAHVLSNGELTWALLTTLPVVALCLLPLYKPRPRRILDTIFLAEKRVLTATFALAAVGYFDYTYRLPRTTLALTSAVLLIAVPAWFIVIRRQPTDAERVVVVGDDPEEIDAVLSSLEMPVLGYVAPPSPYYQDREPPATAPARADGAGLVDSVDELACLGGLSRLDDILVEYDVDTVVLAFESTNRAEFFGALGGCHDHGVAAKVHREHADSVLLSDSVEMLGDEAVVDIDLEPWDWQDHLFKRAFDIAFASVGLLVWSPVIVFIALVIKLDSPGPVLYRQGRTAEFGETFTVYKFRSMVENAEEVTGAVISDEDAGGVDSRVTRIGQVLRKTHLDELPQLWSILVGDMSVVGPRPERPELDTDMEGDVVEWRKRWFVKPGLTGLAQINGVTGKEPEKKLRYDTEYIRRQSLLFDVKVVLRQVWQAFFGESHE